MEKMENYLEILVQMILKSVRKMATSIDYVQEEYQNFSILMEIFEIFVTRGKVKDKFISEIRETLFETAFSMLEQKESSWSQEDLYWIQVLLNHAFKI
ncbi:MAG: hypothetical protein EBV07_01710 [Proteobacteria bacterium]|nr:hypothetical protein [Pseudomonadota bacterium]